MLPVNIKQIDNELLSSFLIRIAHANGTNLDTISYKVFRNSKLLTKDIDKYLTSDEIEKISSYINIPFDNIYNMTLYPIVSKIDTKDLKLFSKWFWITPTSSSYKYKTNGLQFCPKCLEENIDTFKIFNRFSFNVACVKHKIQLHTHCPRCNYQYSPLLKQIDDSIQTCTNCNLNLSTIENIPIDIEILTLQNFLNQCIIQKNIVSSPYYIVDKNIKELFFTIKILISFFYRIRDKQNVLERLSNYIDINTKFNFERKLGNCFETLSNFQRSSLLKNVSLLLKIETDELIDIFIISKITYVQFLGTSSSIPHSTLTRKITNYLKLNSHTKEVYKKKKPILPNSIEEVDKLMDDLEQYL